MTLTSQELAEIEQRANDADGTHWSDLDVPRLVAEVRLLESQLATAKEALQKISKYRPDRKTIANHGFKNDLELAIALASALEICDEIARKALEEKK